MVAGFLRNGPFLPFRAAFVRGGLRDDLAEQFLETWKSAGGGPGYVMAKPELRIEVVADG